MAALGLGSGVAVWYMYPTVSWLFGKMQQRLHALGVFLGAYTHKERGRNILMILNMDLSLKVSISVFTQTHYYKI